MVLTTTLASISVCHFLTSDRSLSEVKSSPWKLVRQFLPWISSTRSLTFRNEWSSSFCRSAREISTIRPLRASFAFLRPVVRFTRVLPTLQDSCECKSLWGGGRKAFSYSRMAKVEGALMEYQSFFAKGSVRFLMPFLPLDNLLFLPTAILTTCQDVYRLRVVEWEAERLTFDLQSSIVASQICVRGTEQHWRRAGQ